MNCQTARELLLVVEPSSLLDPTNSAFAAHLRSCEACRAEARVIVDNGESLGRRVRRRSRRRALGVAIGAIVPIAAVVVAVVVTRPTAPAAAELRQPVQASVSVDVQPGQKAAVIRTKDPNVTIVWITRAEGL